MYKVGIGYDVHQLVEGGKLFLGGVEIAHTHGLSGHSDADVLIHAISDALLGAMGEDDIGHFFPNTDSRWKGVRSTVFLQEISRLLALRGGRIVNVDSSLIAEAPKIAPHIREMKYQIATALNINSKAVGIKATTNETMGFVGRKEGIAAMAIASVTFPDAPSYGQS
ncbi:MAG: 2-C-methyl-D-erythritol 2,4-cyclodiphosphate synthase [Clostridia bacterium]|nr:2-C-methyl-D-erythritol 2,4-cyclodiphosphate synthase [Clostridia bacterium]